MADHVRPITLQALRVSGWVSKTVKHEIHDNFLRMLDGEELFPRHRRLRQHRHSRDQHRPDRRARHAVSRRKGAGQEPADAVVGPLSRSGSPLSSTFPAAGARRSLSADQQGRQAVDGERPEERNPDRLVAAAEDRYAERLAPGTKFADIIGEIDPAKLAGGTSMSAEEALHFGLIPRMHRGIFAMNEVPELDELVQVGLFNILEERDVQIRGYPIQFDIDVLILFSANPATYNRSGKVIPQLKDRIGSVIHTHYPRDATLGIEIMEQEAAIDLGGDFPVVVPYFMREIIEQISICARKSKYVDHQSGVSARFSIANYRTMVASARHRGVRLGEKPAVPRISDLGHLYSSSLGKLELDMMGSHQMSERQVLEAVVAEAIGIVFEEYVDKHGLDEIAEIFGKGVKIEVGDMLPSAHYAERLKRVPKAWDKAFEVNAERQRGGAGGLRRVRAGGAVCQRPNLAVAEAWADYL